MLFAAAPDVVWLFAGRALMGFGLAMSLGAVASAMSMDLPTVAVARHSLPALLLATAVAGAGYNLLFVSALAVINGASSAERRGEVLSALFLLVYLSMRAVALVLGSVATVWGLGVAVDLGPLVIGMLSVTVLGCAVSMRRGEPAKAVGVSGPMRQ